MKTKVLFFIFLCLLLAGCSTQRRCERRLAFVERHCPDCFTTVTVRDTIIREGWKHDTAFIIGLDTIPDTFYIEKEKVSVRIVRHTDTLFCTVENNPDTVYIEQVVNVPQLPKSNGKVWARVAALFGLLFLLSVLGWIIRLKLMK